MTKEVIFGVLRICVGWIFLWPFLDKVFGWGFATEAGKAWVDGVSPTTGFLSFGTKGPFAEFFQNLAGQPFVDWLFMLGLLLIGVSLMLGIMVRLAAIFGAVMLLLMYTAALPPEHNPVVDEHIIYTLVLFGMLYLPVGDWLGFGRQWKQTALVRKHQWLA